MKKNNLDLNNLPKHIALIMDGNRRWAKEKGMSVSDGHRAGADNLDILVKEAERLGIKYLTFYTLSTENWKKRSAGEVKGIFQLLLKIIKDKAVEYKTRGVRLFILGNFHEFPKKIALAIDRLLKIVLEKEKLKVNLALNYGGRDEIVRAVKEIVKQKIPPEKITEQLISDYLYTKGQPDPDLVIRTGGDIRISNFLIWQLSYSELYFTKTYWPDFGPKEFQKAIIEYQNRQRRFGR